MLKYDIYFLFLEQLNIFIHPIINLLFIFQNFDYFIHFLIFNEFKFQNF